jgi:sugar O-acyltransferase (sialic acid O-acetyltransferase NeuD family)
MAQLALQINEAKPRWDFAGFVSASGADTGLDLGFARVVGDDAWLLASDLEADLVVGIGIPRHRARAIEPYLRAGARFSYPNLNHPTALLDQGLVQLGVGNVITAGCIFTTDIQMGDFNLINWQTTVGHDSRIGSYNVLNPSVNVSGGVTIGDRVLIGAGAQILEGRTIGSDATVGAGAVVTRDAEGGTTVVGVPAKPTV